MEITNYRLQCIDKDFQARLKESEEVSRQLKLVLEDISGGIYGVADEDAITALIDSTRRIVYDRNGVAMPPQEASDVLARLTAEDQSRCFVEANLMPNGQVGTDSVWFKEAVRRLEGYAKVKPWAQEFRAFFDFERFATERAAAIMDSIAPEVTQVRQAQTDVGRYDQWIANETQVMAEIIKELDESGNDLLSCLERAGIQPKAIHRTDAGTILSVEVWSFDREELRAHDEKAATEVGEILTAMETTRERRSVCTRNIETWTNGISAGYARTVARSSPIDLRMTMNIHPKKNLFYSTNHLMNGSD